MEQRQIDYAAIREKVLSYSSLKEFKKSPEHFVEYMFGPKKTSPAMEFGTLLDKMILTPNEWQSDYVIKPKFDLRTNVGKAGLEKFLEDNKGKNYVTQEEMDEAKFITEKVKRNKAAQELLERVTEVQQHFQFTDKKTGLKIRGFKDGRGDGFIMDLKSTQNADPKKFIRSAIDYDYPLQAGVYVEAAKVLDYEFPEYYFLCVETTAPYGISVLKASDDFVNLGKQQLRMTLDKFKWALDNLMFNESYEFHSITGWHSLELPAWAKNQLSE